MSMCFVYCVSLAYVLYVVLSVFFFQAEDGIRDLTVTGVQTCALPISITHVGGQAVNLGFVTGDLNNLGPHLLMGIKRAPVQRSEERRVGKECRSRWSPYH